MSDESELMVMEAEAALAEGELLTPPFPALHEYTPDAITGIFTRGFSQQSERDKQVKLGPSEIGGCAYCVGHTMAQKLPDPPRKRDADEFGYAAWIGTMCHFWLEQNLVLRGPDGSELETLREHKVTVGDISDYGTLKGHTDLYVKAFRRTFDYKFPGKYSYDKVKLAIKKGQMALAAGKPLDPRTMMPSLQYRYQQQMYAHGLITQGYEVEACRIIFLPRHSNNLQDVLHWEEPYNPAMVEAAFNRAEQIWEVVKDGDLAELESDPDCYTCDTYGR